MKLEKINRLFAAYNSNAPANQPKPIEEKQIEGAAAQVEEAVQVARNFGSYAAKDVPQTDQAKLDRIKAEVQNGTYRVDSKEVAKSLLKDLFV